MSKTTRLILFLTAFTVWSNTQASYLELDSVPDPSGLVSLGTLNLSTGAISIDTGNNTNPPTLTVGSEVVTGYVQHQNVQINGTNFSAVVGVLCFDSININADVSISVSGSSALALVSKGDILLQSDLSVGSAGASNYGKGMETSGNQFFNAPGGAYGNNSATTGPGPRGEFFPGANGYGQPALSSILLGGSSGGNTWDGRSNTGGAGGGALALVAGGALTVNATITATGGSGVGQNGNGQSGGGSGGGILLAANQINLGNSANILATGGSGGAGSLNEGTGGRIALHYLTLSSSQTNPLDHLDAGNGTKHLRQVMLSPELRIRISEVELCWSTITNAWYQVQYRSELTTNQWTPLFTGWIAGIGSDYCTNTAVTIDQPQRFYQVVVTNSLP